MSSTEPSTGRSARARATRSAFGGRYSGTVAVVSGASAGLGRELALGLARAGAVVVAVARREDLLRELGGRLRSVSPGSWTAVCDVGDVQAWRQLLASIESRTGRIDVLVNNAAYDPAARLSDIGIDDFRRTMEVNFMAAVGGTLAVIPGMFERESGIVLNVSSDGGRLPAPGPGAYPASKAALSAFTESVSYRASGRGVHLHVVYPAWMPTQMGSGAVERGLRKPPRFARRTPEQVASIVLARAGGRHLEISASRTVDAAVIYRAMLPERFRRHRAKWERRGRSGRTKRAERLARQSAEGVLPSAEPGSAEPGSIEPQVAQRSIAGSAVAGSAVAGSAAADAVAADALTSARRKKRRSFPRRPRRPTSTPTSANDSSARSPAELP